MKKIKSIFAFVLALVLCIGMREMPLAAETGTAYVATATAYYKHPVTGTVEDAGNNEGLGQSMTESVLHSKALIEKTDSGKLYATVRIFLTDNIENVKFWTQSRGASSFQSVSATLMQENIGGVYCSDYRFQIPAENAVVKASFYVTPMGRDVIFYLDFSNLKEGSSDFIVSVQKGQSSSQTSTETTANTTTQTTNSANTSTQAGSSNSQTTTNTNNSTNTTSNNKTTTTTSTDSSKSTSKSEETTEKESSTTTDTTKTTEQTSLGMELINEADGLVVSDSELLGENADSETTEQADQTKEDMVIPALSWTLVWQCILIITLPSLIIGGGVFGMLIFLKTREED